MSLVVGIDPGHSGAFATYDSDTQRLVGIQDMPTWFQVVGKKKRPRIDALALAEMFDTFELIGVRMVVIEAVGGRPAQSASAAYVFGYGVGLIYMCSIMTRVPIETTPPTTWKKLMNIQGKGKADDSAIMQRANELFPDDRHMFHKEGSRANTKPSVDRAEAAMLAKFGGDNLLRRVKDHEDVENKLTYRNAETQA